tara:strand:- start:5827 stop:6099 length:273 start_codon:yes stop_codon:yes gene_type:complete
MINVSKEAKTELFSIINSKKLNPDQCIRLTVPPVWKGEGDFGLVISNFGVADTIIEFNNKKVLLIDADLFSQLSKSNLNFKDGRFTLDIY